MVSIEEIIAIQKCDKAAQRQQESRKKVDKGHFSAQGHSFKGKEKEKGISIKEGAPQTTSTTVSEDAHQSKEDGKRNVVESVETPPAIRQRTDSGSAVAMVFVFVDEVTDARLVIHPHPLFGSMVLFNKDAPFSSKTSASLLSNPMYNLKLS